MKEIEMELYTINTAKQTQDRLKKGIVAKNAQKSSASRFQKKSNKKAGRKRPAFFGVCHAIWSYHQYAEIRIFT